MFYRKAKRIKELEKSLDLYTRTLYDADKVIEESKKTIKMLTDKNIDLTSTVLTLRDENTRLKDQINHIREVNRNRQKRFRQTHRKQNKSKKD